VILQGKIKRETETGGQPDQEPNRTPENRTIDLHRPIGNNPKNEMIACRFKPGPTPVGPESDFLPAPIDALSVCKLKLVIQF